MADVETSSGCTTFSSNIFVIVPWYIIETIKVQVTPLASHQLLVTLTFLTFIPAVFSP